MTTTECPRSYNAGVDAAAKAIAKRRDDYVHEHGIYDPSTGVTEFPGNGDEYVGELDEIEELIRSLPLPAPATDGAPKPTIPTCAVTGAIPGDGGACGDCDPCIMGEPKVPEGWKYQYDKTRRTIIMVPEGLASPPATDGEAEKLAEELRERTALRYVGDCKCGSCQLVPRELLDRVIARLRSQDRKDVSKP